MCPVTGYHAKSDIIHYVFEQYSDKLLSNNRQIIKNDVNIHKVTKLCVTTISLQILLKYPNTTLHVNYLEYDTEF